MTTTIVEDWTLAYANEPPDPTYVDEIAIERVLKGDQAAARRLTPLEQQEVTRRLLAAGATRYRVRERLGIGPERANRLIQSVQI